MAFFPRDHCLKIKTIIAIYGACVKNLTQPTIQSS